ncbi:MAG: PaaI family thioesterase [Actinomycetota bacterium]
MTDLRADHYRKLERMYLSAPLNDFYQPTIEISEAQAIISSAVREDFFHAAGAVHGSVYFKLLDDSSWFAVASLIPDVFVLTTTFTTYLTRPVSSGTITAVGRVVNEGRTQYLAEAVLSDHEGREIGRGSGTFVRGRNPLTPEIGYA